MHNYLGQIILISKKAGIAIVASLHQVDGHAGQMDAGTTGTAAKIATPHNPAIIYKPGDGVVSSGLAYVAVRACQAVVC